MTVFPAIWLMGFLVLVSLDLVSKKWITNHLNFPQSSQKMIGSNLQNLEPAMVNQASQINILGEKGRILKLKLVFNDKFVFGLGPDFARGNGMILSYGFTVFAILLLFFYRWKNPDLGYPYAWLLVFSGAFGNLIDKLFLKSLTTREWVFSLYPRDGYVNGVVDFLECIWFDWVGAPIGFLQWQTWPSFNLADSYIVTGMIWLLITMKDIKPEKQSDKK